MAKGETYEQFVDKFKPKLTCCGITAARSRVCVGASIIYANGANVRTSFVASQGPRVMSSPELLRLLCLL